MGAHIISVDFLTTEVDFLQPLLHGFLQEFGGCRGFLFCPGVGAIFEMSLHSVGKDLHCIWWRRRTEKTLIEGFASILIQPLQKLEGGIGVFTELEGLEQAFDGAEVVTQLD